MLNISSFDTSNNRNVKNPNQTNTKITPKRLRKIENSAKIGHYR